MLKKIYKQLWATEDKEDLVTSSDIHVRFLLSFEDLFIGTLELDRGKWSFSYTDEFRKQNKITPLLDFPDVDRTYESIELWPFFVTRIPGLNQPKVKEILMKEKINSKSYSDLLQRFGRETIANPYTLKFLSL